MKREEDFVRVNQCISFATIPPHHLIDSYQRLTPAFLFRFQDSAALILTLNWLYSNSQFPQPKLHLITLSCVSIYIIFLFHLSQILYHDANVFYLHLGFWSEVIGVSFITLCAYVVPNTIKLKDPWTSPN